MVDARYVFEINSKRNWLGQLRHYLTLKAGNGEVVMTGESNGYINRSDAEGMAMHLRLVIPSAKIKFVEK